jgi:hypothetical protein
VFARLHIERVVWACLRAGFTTDASSAVEIYNAVFSREESAHRTDLDTWCIGAVIAPHHRKQAPRVRKCSLLDVFDPCSVNADGYLVLGLAGYRACMAADALSVVDYEAEIHREMK